jgi:beta-lactam-binding protein with PASTA domain
VQLHFGRRSVLMAAGLAAMTVAILASPASAQRCDDVVGTLVPGVVGSTEAQAQATLVSAGLRVGRVSRVVVPGRPAGQVLRQAPQEGACVNHGSVVALTVTRAADARVPDVVGSTLEQAQRDLVRAQLRRGALSRTAADAPEGTVIRQGTEPGTMVPVGTQVALVVSRGPPPVRMPDLTGATLERAGAILSEFRLRLAAVDSAESDAAAGTVVRQRPAPGTEVAPGAAVAVTLARAQPPPVRARVPRLLGLTQERAAVALERAGLRMGAVGTAESDLAPGTVVAQSLAPGTEVAPGTAIGISLATVVTVAVPDVTGGPLANAGPLLQRFGLVPGTVEQVDSDDAAANTVLGQSPAAGTRVPAGTPVSLSVARPRAIVVTDVVVPDVVVPDVVVPDVVVPDVMRLPLGRAVETLEAAGFRARVDSVGVDSARADSAEWVVKAQSPAGGTDAPPGTLVALTVEPDPPLPWVVVVVLLVLGAAAAAWRRGREILGRVFGRGAPVVTTSGAWDPGATRVSVAGKLVSGPPVTFSAGGDPGVQAIDVDGELITAEVER